MMQDTLVVFGCGALIWRLSLPGGGCAVVKLAQISHGLTQRPSTNTQRDPALVAA
jgi:hypothetical protein